MRATSIVNHILQVPGARISDVTFNEDGVIATIARKYTPYHPRCSGCRRKCTIKEARERTFRHLDACGLRVWLKCEVRRVHCPDCGDVYERVPWARGASKYTSQFEDVSAFQVQQSNQSAVSLLMRVAWRTIGKIITRVAAELIDPGRLDGLVHIAVDEVCYGAEHRFLTCVANHRTRDHLRRQGPRRRRLAGILRPAHPGPESLNRGRLNGHVRRLREGRTRLPARRGGLL